MKNNKNLVTLFVCITFSFLFALSGLAKIDIVTLPTKKDTKLIIYNSADLTLVREKRYLNLQKGINNLEFSWENTQIDPTSIDIQILDKKEKVTVKELKYPSGKKNSATWKVISEINGATPIEISYFISGISWSASYIGSLNETETSMDFEGYVKIINNSGEVFNNAEIQLVVGKINILDKISKLSGRDYPYGSPENKTLSRRKEAKRSRLVGKAKNQLVVETASAARRKPKKIKKEGVSEYFLYSIEGTTSIKNNWAKRLPLFTTKNIPINKFYKYEESEFGEKVISFLEFKNDKKHNLGNTPLPEGRVKLFRKVNKGKSLKYVGATDTSYVPLGGKVKFELGESKKVFVESKVRDYKKQNIVFDDDGDVNGFDEMQEFNLQITNLKDNPIDIKIIKNMPNRYWDLVNKENPGSYEKIDQSSFKHNLEIKANSKKNIIYELTRFHGVRRRNR